MALVWKPGQATPIHDHRCWCVVGVWRGLERETTYNLHSDNGTPYLLQRHVVETRPGDVSVLVPPDEDIHRVENGGTELAISRACLRRRHLGARLEHQRAVLGGPHPHALVVAGNGAGLLAGDDEVVLDQP